ncbi:putative leucine-rich repeat protein (LRRP) [Trypanosoma theileri]|uniref:Putative leucine-rich repeat protein (LRRP) n=1 Tax=Trypanosoma theileri TaxID=67003 RepID=A0A1X0P2E5_9TRYP|nr:putative leucine-rich repeat protein (LRRP) [Trypanosoma theileri]ORC91082.1 putative leucine-rich repeat protein (LRRP) [Trypanosoma theileri]
MILGVDVLAGIAERLVEEGNERAVCLWYAAHPRTMLSVISTPTGRRRAGRRFPSVEDTGDIVVELNVLQSGVQLNAYESAVPVPVVLSQLALLTAVIKRPSRVRISCKNVRVLEELLLSAQNLSNDTLIMNIITLETVDFSILLERYKRGTGKILEPLQSVEHLTICGRREMDGKLNGICELKNLKTLITLNTKVFSLLPLRGMKNLSDINIRDSSISDSDINILGQLVQLRRLIIDSCNGITSLTSLSNHPSLRYFSAASCRNLRLVSALASIATLDYVNLSHTAVKPDELLECIQGLQSVKFLTLDGLRLPNMQERLWNKDNLRFLSLIRVITSYFDWIIAARCLAELCLDSTGVTEKQLSVVCESLLYLRVLSVCKCLSLKTSLSFLLPLMYMRTVRISHPSLRDDSVVPILREHGVQCLIY